MAIKPTYIKALSQELLAKHGNRFSNDFDANKIAVEEVAVINSKSVRNRVAGAITRKVNRRKVI
ncbi:30S ribosomal protein S17e [Methanoplanus sp. FWC-SCC4]|uniref:Small ribosomal subunit protein eS17 n=1 Tax=Methanochimaera problematica TaxID=2609417 RepID=A0AA97FF20_9EURY|nr:30S ribosomal protein S17e [Methanoplanus sp. FWC-SCC4]WOF16251.1 30S ribosomal protein S17e [Methanoplanus sp. FWC-SCC4]